MADVKLTNVSKIYSGSKKAVDSVDIEIKDKEFVILVGPSGCGKSTTLRMIAGLEEISDGEIYIDGKKVNDISPKDRDIAMVFQNYALYPHMTVFENMAFGLKLRKFPKDEIRERVNSAAQILDMEEYLDRKPKALSGGQRQRVAVGRAIVRKPKVFLFDEPLSNLDAKLRVQMRTEISKLHARLGATMIYVTHDQTEAMTMGDKIVVMKDGLVQQVDSPLSLYNSPTNKFVAGFIGSPSMNFIDGIIKSVDGVAFESANKEISFNIPDQYKSKLQSFTNSNVTIGIRPEHMSLVKDTSDNTIVIKTKLDVIEPMGNEIFIYFDIGPNQLTGRISTEIIPKVGDDINIYMNSSKLHFFESNSEKTI